MGKKKLLMRIKIYYTCSDFKKHYHRYKFVAWICGRLQYFFNKIYKWLGFTGFAKLNNKLYFFRRKSVWCYKSLTTK